MSFKLGLIAAVFLVSTPAATLHERFNAQQAYAYTVQIAGFGERWPGSPGHKKTEDLIHQVLQKNGGHIEADDFTARTPRGPIPVHNIIGKFNVSTDPKQEILILAGHYDTLFQPGFIGANDGGSSTAILLGFADALAGQKTGQKTKMQIWLVWTDLEEAINSFTGDDGLYGSRHLAQKLAANGTSSRVRGFFLLDMIGDKQLGVARETESNRRLQDVLARANWSMANTSSNTTLASLMTTSRLFRRVYPRWMWLTPDSAAWVRRSIQWASFTTPTPTRSIRFRNKVWKWLAEPCCLQSSS
jgi:hypothetical protein